MPRTQRSTKSRDPKTGRYMKHPTERSSTKSSSECPSPKDSTTSSPGHLGMRFNQDKLQYNVLSPYALRELSRIGTVGAKKYERHNWTQGLLQGDTFDSLLRHLEARRMGEIYDTESGMLHTAHALWNAMALCHFDVLDYLGLDDLTWHPDSNGWVHPSLSPGMDISRNRDNRASVRIRQSKVKS